MNELMRTETKTTAPNPSVAADAGQSSQTQSQSNNVSIADETAPNKHTDVNPQTDPHSLEAYLPKELVRDGHFCCWRYEERDGRLTKVPFNPVNGQLARSNNVHSFADFSTADAAAMNYSGIGIGIFDGICAIDLDDCVTDKYSSASFEKKGDFEKMGQ